MLNGAGSSDSEDLDPTHIRRHAWWREGEVYFLVALVGLFYFLRIGDLTIRGEESRRATVAIEMIRGGDWIVPRQQGEPFLSRPPMGSWLIALTTLIRGQCDVAAIRLPTVTAVMFTTLLIYAFCRTFLGKLGAFGAGLAFISMGEILQMGRLAECDMVFASLLSAGWILWLWGYRAGWPEILTWCIGFGFAGLATLQKGLQAPIYFMGSVWLFLIVRGQWRRLWSFSHLAGLLTFVLIVGAWQIPFLLSQGWESTRLIWWSDTSSRVTSSSIRAVLAHLVIYPLEDLGCTAPASLLLIAYLSRRFRNSLGEAGPVSAFFGICTVVGFLPCWLSPGAMTRYVMPLYPGIAILAGIVVDRTYQCAWSPRIQRAWSIGWRVMAGAMVLAPVVFFSLRAVGSRAIGDYATSVPVTIVFALGSWSMAILLIYSARNVDRRAVRISAVAVALFVAGAYSTVVMNGMVRRSEDTPTAVAQVKSQIPHGVRLISLGGTHHLFAYLFGTPIQIGGVEDVSDSTWFCYQSLGNYRWPMPFPHEIVAVVSVDRNHMDQPKDVVVVGRRITAAPASSVARGGD